MLIKKAYLGEFRHLLSIIRLASLDNRSYIAFPVRKFRYKALLDNLYQQGFIEAYEIRNEFFIISLKQFYWKSFQIPVHSINEINTLSGRLRLDRCRKSLEKKQIKKGAFLYSVISTDKGLISGADALAKKVGGLPLFDVK